MRFEINIVGLRKITTDWETLQPGERATKSRSAVNEDSGTPTLMSIIACLAPESGAAPGARRRTSEDWPSAAAGLSRIRQIIAVNLPLGLLVVVIGASGRYWG